MAKDFNFQSVYVHAIEDSSATLNLDWGELSASDIIVFACDNTGNVTQYYNWEVSKNDADGTYNLEIFNSDKDFTAYVYRRESVSMQWSETANANLSVDAVKKQIEQIVRCVKQIEVQNKSGINAVDSVEGRLPDSTKRADKFLTFDDNGNPVADMPVDTLESNRKLAQKWAIGTDDVDNENPTGTNNAKYYSNQAEDSKTLAQQWAIGSNSTTDKPNNINNAKYYSNQAKNAKALAQKWAIGTDSTTGTPSDTNNAKYYAEQASGIVDGFNSTVELAVTSAMEDIDDKVDEECVKLESYAKQAETAETNARNSETNAEAWATGTSDVSHLAYNNNAKYYAEQAKTAVSGFNADVEQAKSDIDTQVEALKDDITKTYALAESDFNINASQKTTDFNDDYMLKFTAFNSNATNRAKRINDAVASAESQIQNYINEAKDIRDQTKEIADPEEWLTNTRLMINDLQQTKINRGEIFLQNGKIEASQTIEMNGAFSVVWTATIGANLYGGIGKDYRKPYVYTGIDSDKQKGLTLTMDDSWAGFYFRWWKSNGSAGRISNTLNVQKYFDGKPHVWAYVFNGTRVKLIVDGSIIANAPVDDFAPTTPTNPLTITSPNSTISRIKYFNFDMSAEDAPYTIADYIAGKDESLLLQGGENYSSTSNWTARWSNASIVDTTNTLEVLTTKFEGSPNLPIIVPVRSFIAGQTIEVSYDSITTSSNLTLINPQVYILGGLISSYTPITGNKLSFVVEKTGTGKLEFVIKVKESNIPEGTTFVITGLKIKVNGALLSLDDYSFNGKIADVSGNNNDATITDYVYGTRDKSVEKMYQAFASKIGNVTE